MQNHCGQLKLGANLIRQQLSPDHVSILQPIRLQTETSRKIGTGHLMTADVIELIEQLLTLDPTRRWSANKV